MALIDISDITKSTGLALERQAATSFGAVVEEFITGTSGSTLDRTGDLVTAPAQRIDPSTWYATSYAAALAGTNFRPKLKFLFKIEFIFKPQVLEAYPQLKSNDFTFLIKSVDRPKIDFEYEDDINMYNFRTKVLKRIRHRDLTLTFMDDTGNRVFDFFQALMFVHSPITERSRDRIKADDRPTSDSITGGSGMTFGPLGKAGNANTAHRGVINTNFGGAIETIRVKQMFMDISKSSPANAARMVIFDFMNPRLVSLDLDDLNHESSDANLLTMSFDYDWMEMAKLDTVEKVPTPVFPGVSAGAQTAPIDAFQGITNDGTRDQIGANNPFAAILNNAAGRATQKVTADLVNKSVRGIAGNGRFATAVAGALTPALGGAARAVASGIVGAASNDLLGGINSNIRSGYNSAIVPIARDSATLSSDGATITRPDGGT